MAGDLGIPPNYISLLTCYIIYGKTANLDKIRDLEIKL